MRLSETAAVTNDQKAALQKSTNWSKPRYFPTLSNWIMKRLGKKFAKDRITADIRQKPWQNGGNYVTKKCKFCGRRVTALSQVLFLRQITGRSLYTYNT